PRKEISCPCSQRSELQKLRFNSAIKLRGCGESIVAVPCGILLAACIQSPSSGHSTSRKAPIRPEGAAMSAILEVNLAIWLWGALVLAAGTVRYYCFDGQCIQIDLPVRSRQWWSGFGRD